MKTLLLALGCLLGATRAMAQYTLTQLETGGYYTAVACDNDDNIYVVRYNSTSSTYEVARYIPGAGAPTVIYEGLTSTLNSLPWGIAVNDNGDVFVSSINDDKIIKLTRPASGTLYNSQDIQTGDFTALAIAPNNDLLALQYLTGPERFQLVRYPAGNENAAGTVVTSVVNYPPPPADPETVPWGLAMDAAQNIYVLDLHENSNGRVIRVNYPGYGTSDIVASGGYYTAIAIDNAGNFYTTEKNGTAYRVVKRADISQTGEVLLDNLNTDGLSLPWGLAVNSGGEVFVGDGSSPTGGRFVKLSPPGINVSSVVRADPSPANDAIVQYTVTFSGPATNVTAAAFTLSTTGVAGAGIASVNGSGTTYTVTVSTGTGDGTIRLDVNGAGISPAVLNAPYQTGEVYTIDRTAPTGTLEINSGSALTNNLDVTLGITANAADHVTPMQFSNDDVTYSAYEALAATKSWTLAAGDGLKTVYMQLRDAAGNVTTVQDQITLDQTAPETTISSAPPANTSSTDAAFEFDANETALFEASLDGGPYTPASSPLTYTGLAAGTHTFSLRATDQAGNVDGSPATHSWTIDQTAPVITSVDVPADGYYHEGDVMSFTVNFNENITLLAGGNTPYLELTIGTATVQAAYTGSTGTDALTFSYTVLAGQQDLDGITLGGNIVLNGGTIQDAAGNNAALALNNVAPVSGIWVYAITPTVTLSTTAVSPVNLPFTVTVVFSEQMTGFTLSDVVATNAVLSSLNTVDDITYTMHVIPTADGPVSIQVPADVAQNTGLVNNTASNTLSLVYDGTGPVVTSVDVPANSTYSSGDVLTFTVNYNEEVTVSGGTPSLELTIGADPVQAVYTGGTGTNALTFSYTVADGDLDEDGISLAAAIELNGATMQDAATNDAALTLAGAGNTSAVLVDAVAPVVSNVNVPANGYYKEGDVLTFTVQLSGNVTVNAAGGTPYLELTIGTATVQAVNTGGTGTSMLTFSYTVLAGQQDLDGIALGSSIVLNGGSIQDAAGNDAVLTLNSVPGTGGIFVYSVTPTVTLSTTAVSPVNQEFTVSIVFSEAVTGFALADITATNATLSNLQTTNNITYTALVTPSADGAVSLSVPAGAAQNIGNIDNTASNMLSLDYDGTAPAVISVDVPSDDIYHNGDVLTFTVHCSENVTVSGAPSLELIIGTTTVQAAYVSGTGTSALTFSYTVQPGDLDMDGIALGSNLVLNGSTLQDAAGNAAALALNNLGNTSGVLVNTQRPSVTLSTAATGRVNTPVTVTLLFSEAVTGLAAADISVTNGAAGNLQTTDNITYTADITPAADGAVEVSLPADVAANIGGNGNDASNTVAFTYDATAPLIAAGQSFTVGQYEPAGATVGQVTATDAAGTLQSWAIATDGSGGAFEIDGSGTLTVKDAAILAPLGGTTVTLQVTVSDGLNTSAATPVTIQVGFVNQAPALDPIADVSSCADTETHTLQLTGASATEPGQTYTITAAASQDVFELLTVDASNVLSYRLKAGAAAGNITITVTIRDDGGTASGGVDSLRRSFTITVNDLPVVNITSDKGTTVSRGATVMLTATGGATYQWADADGIISGQQSAVLEIRPKANTTYEVTATSAAGCTGAGSIDIAVVDDFKVDATNILTPNGDGRNDRWVVRNIDSYPDNEVKIFDRAGRLVYQRRNYSNDWDGTLNGSPLAEGTYYYILTINSGAVTTKGYITIVRDRQ